MNKTNDKNQDGLHPDGTAFDDIPFAIEVNMDGDSTADEVPANSIGNPEGDSASGIAPCEENIEDNDAAPVDSTSVSETNVSSTSRRKSEHYKGNSDSTFSLRGFLFGDFLSGTFLRGQVKFILFLALLGILYISNRYAAQQEILEVESLRKELVEKKNYALTQYAELTMTSRQSGLESRLRAFGDSLLTTSTEPPFVIQAER